MDNAQESSRARNPQPEGSPPGATPPEDVWRRFEEAYRNYMRALREAWVPRDVQRRFEEAYLNYVRALLEARAPEDSLRRLEAYLNYVRALREAWVPEDIRRRFEEAYRNYVRALKETWAQVDVNAMNVDTMAAISQSMMAALWCAWATLPRASWRGAA
jgi:hypothetical protein